MTRMSAVFLLAIMPVTGCTSDPLGLRTSYRDRVVAPSANNQPNSSPPIALQPGGQLGQPVGIGQSAFLPQSALSNNLTLSQGQRQGWNGPYPMLASAGGQVDGRSFPLLTREVRIPRSGGAQSRKNLVRNTAIAGGRSASPMEDLKYRGGWTIRDMKYMNIYVGGSEMWDPNDWKSIDKKLAAAMSDFGC